MCSHPASHTSDTHWWCWHVFFLRVVYTSASMVGKYKSVLASPSSQLSEHHQWHAIPPPSTALICPQDSNTFEALFWVWLNQKGYAYCTKLLLFLSRFNWIKECKLNAMSIYDQFCIHLTCMFRGQSRIIRDNPFEIFIRSIDFWGIFNSNVLGCLLFKATFNEEAFSTHMCQFVYVQTWFCSLSSYRWIKGWRACWNSFLQCFAVNFIQ